MKWIPLDTSHYTVEFCKQRAKELRKEGRKVRLGSYLREEGKTYCKIYLEIQNANQ